jgi:hypothetical protein
MRQLTVVVALMLLASLHAGRALSQQPTDEPLLQVSAQLTRDDPLDPVLKKGFHKAYMVKLAAGTYYRIDLGSKDFDALLRLENADGVHLAHDHEGGDDLNARIIYRPTKDGAYRVIVTTFAGTDAVGKFRLTVNVTDRAAAEEHKLVQAAERLRLEGTRLYQQANVTEAMERFVKVLELLRRAFPKERYPHGEWRLARALNNLGVLFTNGGQYVRRSRSCVRRSRSTRQSIRPRSIPTDTPTLPTH